MALIFDRRLSKLAVWLLLTISISACQTVSQDTQSQGGTSATIEASPIVQGEGEWKIATEDSITLSVNAPGARSARILYRPIIETDRHVVLKNVKAEGANGKLSAAVKLVPDFAGEVWAEASFADGTKKVTEPILLARYSAVAQSEGTPGDSASYLGSIGNDDSPRSDKFTGGKIEHASLQPGQPDIAITVDVPAFRMTLWQNRKEVRTYEIGVGLKKFPIVIGERRATQVIWNPEWVPPDSEWVIESRSDVEPGERIEAGDPRNPLGKIKIPLGDGFLIHQAQKPSDIGRLVSHGCIRMMKEDLLDLATKIVAARSLNITAEQIQRAMTSTERLVAKLNPAALVDINYDTIVVEGGILHVYPDIYERSTNTVQNLRAELQSVGAEVSSLDDQTLKQVLDRANPKEEFKVSIADIRSGNALVAGTNQPLTSQSVPPQKGPAKSKGRQGGRGRR